MSEQNDVKFHVTVRMIRPFHATFIHKPSVDHALEALADMILQGNVDDLFTIEIEKSEG